MKFGRLILCVGLLGACGAPQDESDDPEMLGLLDGKEDSISSTSTYYRLRPDFRRCAWPMCGGSFVSRLNRAQTKCDDGQWADECYVADVSFGALANDPRVANENLLVVRGRIAKATINGRSVAQLKASEAWESPDDKGPVDDVTFYRVKDAGIRCIHAPCPSIHEAKLNSTISRNVHDLDLSGTGATQKEQEEATSQMYGSSILVAGENKAITQVGQAATALVGKQLFTRIQAAAAKTCIKTGCSGHICADDHRISTCEWRPEYACYQAAKCEAQADGNCGWTQTQELTACLANP